jgi:Leucine-rich repeat (LRR) protein
MKNIFTKTILLLAFLGLNFNDAKAQYVDINNAALLYVIQSVYPSCVVNNQLDTTCSGILNATTFSIDNQCQCLPNVDDLNGIQYFKHLQTLNISSQPVVAASPLPSSLKKLIANWTFTQNWNGPIPVDLSNLPDSLEHLESTNCHLTNAFLPSLPSRLTYLNLSNNKLTSVPTLPDSLNYFNCSTNLITSLPALPDNLNYFNCSINLITNLPVLPNALEELWCYTNSLTALPSLPSSLTIINCNFNDISNLPNLPTSLEGLSCSDNNLSSLPNLPSTLKSLNCKVNQITNLPNLPSLLESLDCSKNDLSIIPNLPATLNLLYCDRNQLSNLPSLPNSLLYLVCNHNQLTSLPTLPNYLTILNCTKNLLQGLQSLPNTITQFYVDSNNISCLPVLPNLIYPTYFKIAGNPITCVPNYVPAMNAATLALPLCQDNDLINNPAGCDQSKGIIGIVYKDTYNYCVIDNNEAKLKNIKVKFFNPINNQFGSTYSISNGIFNYVTDPGTYITLIDTLDKPYSTNCLYPGTDTTVVTTIAAPLVTNVNFGLVCRPGLDLNVQSVKS